MVGNISITDMYMSVLSSLSVDEKLDLIAKLTNVILFIFRLLYINKIIITTPCKRNRIETRSVF